MTFQMSITSISILVAITTLTTMTTASPQNEFVAVHNAIRGEVGVGPMTWNETLAKYARDYSSRRASTGCNMVHSGGPYGENLAEGYGEMSGTQAVKFWATEKTDYDRASNTCKKGAVCGHYTQIVWRHSVRLGCATLKCPNDWVFAICSYDPPGNYIGERPY